MGLDGGHVPGTHASKIGERVHTVMEDARAVLARYKSAGCTEANLTVISVLRSLTGAPGADTHVVGTGASELGAKHTHTQPHVRSNELGRSSGNLNKLALPRGTRGSFWWLANKSTREKLVHAAHTAHQGLSE